MTTFAIAFDIGTSGIRAQVIEQQSQEIIATVITARHPIPGANVIDHLHFALEMGINSTQRILVQCINQIIKSFPIDHKQIMRMSVCGNPIQLSLFQGIEIRDLAFAGKQKQQALGISTVNREALITNAGQIKYLNLSDQCEVIIPPAVQHEIGADALAMIIQSNMLESKETTLITDYGTNAEMALLHNGCIYSGSTAAGPALEGQQINSGMLAAPGAITDILEEPPYYRLRVLDAEMNTVNGPLIEFNTNTVIDPHSEYPIRGITGTGTIAAIFQAMSKGLIHKAQINTPDNKLHLGSNITFNNHDFHEAGKAIGAIRAGHISLCNAAGISLSDISVAYMSGASGTYMDAHKAQQLGLIPTQIKKVYQIGNTSLAMAKDLLTDSSQLQQMTELATQLQENHCMFARSDVFKKVFMLELAYWTEGMPWSLYQNFLKKYQLPAIAEELSQAEIVQTVTRDINTLGSHGLTTLTNIGQKLDAHMNGCLACQSCTVECPEQAIKLSNTNGVATITLDQSLCNGIACKRCEQICSDQYFKLSQFFK